jgi:hypothetical protein
MPPMRRLIPIVVVAINAYVSLTALACPFCKDSVPNSDAQQAGGVPSGFNNTIYIMLGALCCVLAMVSFTLVKGARGSVNGQSERGFPLE